ncbi:DUF1800 domain-containing protein [Pseudolabrys taiwanensis]|uniref:DUF1800 domain-containing protein n=1 Tax=Pseudolabrys taiwanensis TaxID=331696 RepID=A0A345ZRF3_9HYPH|nr:DUF1800 domain-containing protein [Pseudolabrys taiwanensis]AXK79500.1 DUF1800 domain-containing protein [Pseudolabrys taiwanensis]
MAVDPSTDSHTRAALALHRFGMGPRPGDIDKIAHDPRGALLAELRAGVKPLTDPALVDSGRAARDAFAFQLQQKAEREAAQRMQAEAAANTMAGGNNAMPAQPQPKPGPGVPQELYLTEAQARYQAALDADIGLTERLVWFWSNHFCISADKGPTRPICGAYEREAIRPHVLGKFSDMLLAVETHPGMLYFLDNVRSIGPNSFAGVRQHKGLNENLAREIMELHTLGVRSGYSQTDVTNFAKVITGWTVRPLKRDEEHGGEFWFNERMHEPGPQTILGKTYPEDGDAQGRAVLLDLARHPATATHIATKLAIHFVADTPPKPLVDRLAKRFRDTQGDLMEVTKTLVMSPEAWSAARTKLKKPGEWTIAAMRASGLPLTDVRRIVNTQNLLGEPLWRPPAPKGFSDDSAAWMDGIAQRLDIANQVARLVGNTGTEPDAMVDAALGPLASDDTRQTIKRAESRPQALALLLMTPEFQRR